VATGPICGGARYSPARRRASNSTSVVRESENKVEETRGDSLKKEAIKKKAIKKKNYGRRSRYID